MWPRCIISKGNHNLVPRAFRWIQLRDHDSTSRALCCVPSVKKQKHVFGFCCSIYNKTTFRSGFCDIQNNQGLGTGELLSLHVLVLQMVILVTSCIECVPAVSSVSQLYWVCPSCIECVPAVSSVSQLYRVCPSCIGCVPAVSRVSQLYRVCPSNIACVPAVSLSL